MPPGPLVKGRPISTAAAAVENRFCPILSLFLNILTRLKGCFMEIHLLCFHIAN